MTRSIDQPSSHPPDHEVVIVGSGFSGIGAAIKLESMGIRDYLILEKADDLGGTWRDNDYPGLAVDMPSFIYCYPLAMSAHWSRVYPPAHEIKAYADHCADKYGVRPHIRFGKTVVETVYDSARNAWLTRLDDGEAIASRFFVSASGLLIEPELPDIAGIDEFRGKLLHSARWDHDYDLTGKRVAVIGTGATAVQLIPTIAAEVARLDVYQRTAIWLMGKPDAAISAGWERAFRAAPLLQDIVRWTINVIVELSMGPAFVRYKQFPWMFRWLERKLIDSIRSQVDDPETQEKLIPKYSFFCKRPSFSNVYYPVFNREHVELITDPIERITENAITTRDGAEREIDALICATGYSVFRRDCAPNFEVFGTDGKNLGDFWQANRFQAYQGASVPGFPNFFLMMGPYSAAGASYFSMIDTQTRHLARCLREARRRNANYVEVKQAAHDRDFRKVERRRENTVLFAGNCASSNSYYFDHRGDTPGLRPVTGLEHWLNSLLFSMRDYDFEQRPE
ncbi:MAG: NAD(P)/FAD-dependent oxidoreductase [Myxococcota bacterium]|nr:NAD(P)/FAD-dependent oxidoreductase [Myxococcota bacterium]